MVQEAKSKETDAPPTRRNRSEPVARCAAMLGANTFARAGFPDPALVLRWREIAGPDVARLCLPVKLSKSASGGVLTLKSEPSASLFLQHESRALCERINAWFGRPAVIRLRFIQGPFAVRPPLPVSPQQQVLRDDDPALSFQGPESVRQTLLRLARQRARPPRPD